MPHYFIVAPKNIPLRERAAFGYHTLVLPMHALIMVKGLWIESCGYVQSQRIRIPASTKTDILDPTHKAPRRVLTAWEAKRMRWLIPQNLNIRDIICAA